MSYKRNSSQTPPSSQQTVTEPSSQQTLSEPSSRNSSQSSQQQNFQQRPTQRTSSPQQRSPVQLRTSSPQQRLPAQQRTSSSQQRLPPQQRTSSPQQHTTPPRGRSTARRPYTYHGSPFSLVVDLPPSQTDISSHQQPQQQQIDPSSSSQQQVDFSSQQKQVDIRLSEMMKRYRVPKSYAAAVSGSTNISPRREPIKHEESETETGTYNSNLLLRLLVIFTNRIHVSLLSKKFKKGNKSFT
jgi:hypothetical protein